MSSSAIKQLHFSDSSEPQLLSFSPVWELRTEWPRVVLPCWWCINGSDETETCMKLIVPVVMAGVLGIYGLIIAVVIGTGINPKVKSYYLFDGYAHLSSGLACGLAGLSARMAIGIVGDAGVRYPILLH